MGLTQNSFGHIFDMCIVVHGLKMDLKQVNSNNTSLLQFEFPKENVSIKNNNSILTAPDSRSSDSTYYLLFIYMVRYN